MPNYQEIISQIMALLNYRCLIFIMDFLKQIFYIYFS
jgi:hypothetical protein